MEHSIEFGGETHDVTATVWGPASIEGFGSLFDELASDPRFRPEWMVLLDVAALDVSELSAEEVRQIATAVARDARLGSTSIAVVAPSPVTFGLARLGDTVAKPNSLDTVICRSREEAETWFRQRAREGD